MAHHKDALKRIKQNEKRRIRNRAYRTQMRNSIKSLRGLIEAGDKDAASDAFRSTESVIHKLVTKGVIHRNQAGRKISRLSAAVAKL